jgi:acetyl esterase/lipase
VRVTIAYGTHPDQVADVRAPVGRPSGLLVVLIHGGDWHVDATRHYLDPMAGALAGEGHCVALLEFRRLGGGGGWPATFDDVALALEEVPRQAGVDLRGTVLVGHSAGGHLALWAAAQPLTVEPPLLGVVALGPTADLALAHDLGSGAVEALLGGAPHDAPDVLARADPAGLPARVPVTILHAEDDSMVPSALSRSYLLRADGEVVYRERPGADHFSFTTPGEMDWKETVRAVAEMGRMSR